ncbi:MAG: peptidase C45 [Bacteroidetes bacterium]|nr:peptidase C45 [Bacteroidota bacterium]
MLKRKKFWRRVLYVIGFFLLLLLAGAIYLYNVAIAYPPKVSNKDVLKLQRTEVSPGFYTLKDNWFRKSNSGLFEMYVSGEPFERGVINGKLSKELVIKQEDYFNEQICKLVPSASYRNFLKYFIGWFNRNLEKNVAEEYKEEIYGISESASNQYQYIGSNYQRILNYHAAHDIGHALQNMALVGCTSFGTWDSKSEDSTMIIGRNFDFFVSDKFAQDKIIGFYAPSKGYKYMSVTWGGFVGVVSGMNEKGLTVTINAAKSDIPTGSATPVSLVAREVLQYAKNIQEAITIARSRKMFVSESFLVGSALDGKAVLIEKTPKDLDVYDPHQDYIVCTNHFQSKGLDSSKDNKEQLKESASPYRYERMMELLNNNGVNTVQKTINILRDRKGLHGADIGMGNEKAVNQLIAHHSIVFEPKKLKVWVSTSNWQLGKYVCYDLNKVFNFHGMEKDVEIYDSSLTVQADSFLLTNDFKQFELFRQMKQRFLDKEKIDPDSIVASNPNFYNAYVIAGDYCYKNDAYKKALKFYETALTKVIATKKEEDHIKDRIKKCNKKLAP